MLDPGQAMPIDRSMVGLSDFHDTYWPDRNRYEEYTTSWGSGLLLFVMLTTVIYLSCGVLINVQRNGMALGVEALPHLTFWR